MEITEDVGKLIYLTVATVFTWIMYFKVFRAATEINDGLASTPITITLYLIVKLFSKIVKWCKKDWSYLRNQTLRREDEPLIEIKPSGRVGDNSN